MLVIQIVAAVLAVVIAVKYLLNQPADWQVALEGKDAWYLILFLICFLLAVVPIVMAH